MRQVAVASSYQRVGIGSQLTDFSHKYAIDKGYNKICCHARKVAVPFYERMKYQAVGAEFIEVGIPHLYMELDL
jgi:predicted GNAT family N-acyltransferase